MPLDPDVSVVILTYRRPESLARTLASCLSQQRVEVAWEIIVVDNDPAESGRPAAEHAMNGAVPVRYLREPRPGISHARNFGVAATQGRCLAFLDDDETANPGWLAAFLETLRRTGADVAVGPVRPCFAQGAVVEPLARRVFTRDPGVPSGTALPGWSGIGNAILVRDRCFAGHSPFDPRLGLSGGEDAIFLGALARQGRRIVWCAEAFVTESIPTERLSARYLLRRAFRGGQTTTFIHAVMTPAEPAAVARWMAIGCAQVLLCGPAGLLLRALGRPDWLATMARAASGLGKVLWFPKLHVRLYGGGRV